MTFMQNISENSNQLKKVRELKLKMNEQFVSRAPSAFITTYFTEFPLSPLHPRLDRPSFSRLPLSRPVRCWNLFAAEIIYILFIVQRNSRCPRELPR